MSSLIGTKQPLSQPSNIFNIFIFLFIYVILHQQTIKQSLKKKRNFSGALRENAKLRVSQAFPLDVQAGRVEVPICPEARLTLFHPKPKHISDNAVDIEHFCLWRTNLRYLRSKMENKWE